MIEDKDDGTGRGPGAAANDAGETASAELPDEGMPLAEGDRLATVEAELAETKDRLLRALAETENVRRRLQRERDDASKKAEGVQIFIGAESHLFGVAGCSLIIAPYQNSREQIVGAIGVIGPTRINYARIIPMVDYTAKMIGRLIG